MWHETAHRLAILELLQKGTLQKRTAQADAWRELLALGWARRTSRQDELAIVPAFRTTLEQVLDSCWTDWRAVQQDLANRGLPPTDGGLRALRSQQRVVGADSLPLRLNQRTAASMLAEHSKSRLGEAAQQRLQASEVTSDYVVRMRGCRGLSLHRDGVKYDAALLEQIQGELVLSERALLDGTTLCGTPSALLLVENVGPFVDLTPLPGWLLVHVPGWHTQGAKRLFEMIPNVPTLHFGDFDPEGLQIYCHLRRARPNLSWVVPDWIADYLPSHGLATAWPDPELLTEAPGLVQQLAMQGRWIEQEALVFDERLWPLLRGLAGV
mgnify:CR=1 FL=1